MGTVTRIVDGPDWQRINHRMVRYDRGTEAVTAAGTINVTDARTTTLAISGTTAYTMAAPTFAGQWKHIVQISGASTPAGTVTVTGCRSTDLNTFLFNSVTADLDTAPMTATFYSPDGIYWDLYATRGVTVG